MGRLELRAHLLDHALKSLPQGLRIVDQNHTLFYSNHSADGLEDSVEAPSSRKCYELMGRFDACEDCPVADGILPSQEPYALIAEVGADQAGNGNPQCKLIARLKASSSGEAGPAPEPIVLGAPSVVLAENRLGSLMGKSEAMQRLFEMINLVATSDATVLLEGESGTGKEVVARTIHSLSRRRDRRFVVIDCGALPDTLLESELFGHVRGAFTSAVATKAGLFEEAEGGTVFLDEIAHTSPALQAKLLRAIQEGEIRPVGGTRSIRVNVRIIAASNQPMAPLVASRAFREDLYYRLAVIPLTIPPFRDRREDMPLLVETFVAEACRRHGREPVSVDSDVMRLLVNHPWPGNVRELKHVIERAVLTAQGAGLAADRLFADLLGTPSASPAASLGDQKEGAVRFLERARILDALRRAQGNRTQAAQLLRISRASFYNKLRKYQLDATGVARSPAAIRHRKRRTV